MLARQFQRLSQMGGVFVAVKAGFVRGDFKQDTAGGAEIDRPEVIPVDHWGHLMAGVHQRLADLKLGRAVFNGESDVVDRACALLRARSIGQNLDVNPVRDIAARNRIARDSALTVNGAVAHELQQLSRGTTIAQTHRRAVKAVNRLCRRHAIAATPLFCKRSAQ